MRIRHWISIEPVEFISLPPSSQANPDVDMCVREKRQYKSLFVRIANADEALGAASLIPLSVIKVVKLDRNGIAIVFVEVPPSGTI